jgi:hypothetical protein
MKKKKKKYHTVVTDPKSNRNVIERSQIDTSCLSTQIHGRSFFCVVTGTFINMLIPVSLMAILIAFVFKLPVESGEKVGFSITVLLSYAVYLTLITGSLNTNAIKIAINDTGINILIT